jgi:hypothetical protein
MAIRQVKAAKSHEKHEARDPDRSLLAGNERYDVVCASCIFLRPNLFRTNSLASFIRDAVFYKVGPRAGIVTY